MFHNNLRAQRLKCRLSQKQVADYLNVSPQSVSKWEKGETLPSIDYLPSLAECLNCDINSFFVKEERVSEDYSTVFTLFELMTDVLNETKEFDDVTDWMLENTDAVDTGIAVCKDILVYKTLNIRSIRVILNCSDAEARTFLSCLERCELVERLDVGDFHYVIKDAVEGFILYLKMRKQVCEVINQLERKRTMQDASL